MVKRHVSGDLLPVHLKPKADELLSSWLVRLAMAHGQKLHTFCSIILPGKAVWNRDIDKSADAKVVQTLADRTATHLERVRVTTLSAYEGMLYEKHNHYGPTAWIMPVGIYHRIRRQFGQQYCPLCLSEDEVPYYRRKWRLAFMVLCERHNVLLLDRCHQCDSAVNFHRDELGNFHKFAASSITLCHKCGVDLREATPPQSNPISPDEVVFIQRMLRTMDDCFIWLKENEATYSHLFFSGLRQLMTVLAISDRRIENLRQDISRIFGVASYTPPPFKSDVQELNVEARRNLLGLSRCLLGEWPDRFIELSLKNQVWSSLWLRHMESGPWERSQTAPFWFWKVVHEHLYRARYRPSDHEVGSAIMHLERAGKAVNKSTLAKALGVSVVRREIVA